MTAAMSNLPPYSTFRTDSKVREKTRTNATDENRDGRENGIFMFFGEWKKKTLIGRAMIFLSCFLFTASKNHHWFEAICFIFVPCPVGLGRPWWWLNIWFGVGCARNSSVASQPFHDLAKSFSVFPNSPHPKTHVGAPPCCTYSALRVRHVSIPTDFVCGIRTMDKFVLLCLSGWYARTKSALWNGIC